MSSESWVSGRGWGLQLFSFQSLVVHWMGGPLHWIAFPVKSSANPSFTECLPPFHWKTLFLTEKCFVASPSQKSAPNFRSCYSRVADQLWKILKMMVVACELITDREFGGGNSNPTADRASCRQQNQLPQLTSIAETDSVELRQKSICDTYGFCSKLMQISATTWMNSVAISAQRYLVSHCVLHVAQQKTFRRSYSLYGVLCAGTLCPRWVALPISLPTPPCKCWQPKQCILHSPSSVWAARSAKIGEIDRPGHGAPLCKGVCEMNMLGRAWDSVLHSQGFPVDSDTWVSLASLLCSSQHHETHMRSGSSQAGIVWASIVKCTGTHVALSCSLRVSVIASPLKMDRASVLWSNTHRQSPTHTHTQAAALSMQSAMLVLCTDH